MSVSNKSRVTHLAVLLAAVLSGCSAGPHALKSNRPSYNLALQQTADEQLLLNIARLKYRERTLFFEVGSVTAGFRYTADADASARMPEHAAKVFTIGTGRHTPSSRP